MWKNYKQNLTPLLLSAALLLLFCAAHLQYIPFSGALMQRLNALTYDLRMRATTIGSPSGFPPIYIIDVDESSLEQEGQWPWSRRKLAQLIEQLYQANSAVIVLDITLAEAEENPVDLVSEALGTSSVEVNDALGRIRQQLDGDQQLARVIQDKGVILGYLFHPQDEFTRGYIKPTQVDNPVPLERLSSLAMRGYTANLEALAQSAQQNGFFTIRQDDDGGVRQAGLILEYDGQLYTSLAVEATKQYLGAESETITLASEQVGEVEAITSVVIAGQAVRTDPTGRIHIPYLGRGGTFPYVSAASVLNGSELPDLTDAVVLIGTSAQALADLRTTPIQASFPGVEIQATIIHALLNPDTIPYTPEWHDGAMVMLMIGVAAVMMLIYPLLRPLGLISMGVMLSLGLIALNVWLWQSARLNLDLILPLLLIVAGSSVFTLHRMIFEHNQRQHIHGMFGQYVPVGHIDRMLNDKKAINMEGERREMTVLFSDIRSFTGISEHLTTQQLKQFLNHYLTPITEIIFRQQGTIDKYIGDLVMAFWGAPLADEKHAEHAVRAALTMKAKTEAMQDEFRALGLKQTVSAGIGINTGEMNVGDMGSDFRRAYTVLGDAVNLGSRLEGLTKQYAVTILVSEDTVRLCPGIVFREIDYVRVKGRNEPVRIYEPVAETSQPDASLAAWLATHQQALDNYYRGQWTEAVRQFEQLSQRYEDGLYRVYLGRMQASQNHPPPDWDGVFSHTSK